MQGPAGSCHPLAGAGSHLQCHPLLPVPEGSLLRNKKSLSRDGKTLTLTPAGRFLLELEGFAG